jgi:hypothetical protein
MTNDKQKQLEKQLEEVIDEIREPTRNESHSCLITRYANLQRQYVELTGERYRVGRMKE